MACTLRFLFLLSILLSNTLYATETDGATCQKIFNYYSKDDQHVYYLGYRLSSADPASFQVIEESHYGKDNSFVYFKEVRIAGADPTTFTVINNDDFNALAKDQYRVYQNETVIESANPQYFEDIGYGFYKDNNAVFYQGIKLPNADPASFIVYSDRYGRDNQRFYTRSNTDLAHNDHASVISTLTFIDLHIDYPEKLTFIGNNYFKDNDNFYLFKDNFIPLNSAKPENFNYIAEGYFHDGNKVYYHAVANTGLTPLDADLHSFKQLDTNQISAVKRTPIFEDKNGCFAEGKTIDCATFVQAHNDIAFSPLNTWLLQEKSTPNIAPNCGKTHGENNQRYRASRWSKDYLVATDHVYYQDRILENADPITFEYVGTIDIYQNPQKYFRDTNHVYVDGKAIKGVDPKSFVLLSDLTARDKNQIYSWQALEAFKKR